MKRTCSTCGVEKPIEAFHRGRTNRGGRRPDCGPCYNDGRRGRYSVPAKRAADLMRRYGITPEDYDALLVKQCGCCAICGSGDPTRGNSHFAVDHCHETGVVRGLLCHTCNRVIGMFKDDASRLRTAADYLEAAACPV